MTKPSNILITCVIAAIWIACLLFSPLLAEKAPQWCCQIFGKGSDQATLTVCDSEKALVKASTEISQSPYQNSGQLGDSFGVINALFAGLAAIFAYMAYTTQVEQLKDSKTLSGLERFETNFYQLLTLFNQQIQDLKWPFQGSTEVTIQGRDVFEKLAKRDLSRVLSESRSGSKSGTDSESRSKGAREVYIEHFENNPYVFSNYISSLHLLLEYISVSCKKLSESSSREVDKFLYSDILRAQLSNHELLVVFCYCLSDQGKRTIHFIEEFALLQNLPVQNEASADVFPRPKERGYLMAAYPKCFCGSDRTGK